MSVHLESPYLPDGIWLRGNLHTHTTRSDGRASPQEVIRAYAALGHDFLAISDHDEPPLVDGVDPCGLVLLPAVEVSDGCPHVLDVGARGVVSSANGQQALLDAINAAGGFPVLCHPNWEESYDHYPWEQLKTLTGYAGIEIFNGLCLDQPGWHEALDKWDRLLSHGRTVWGFANDDAHKVTDPGHGWNVVRAAERTPAAILSALRQGSFYASSGVEIDRLACDGPVLRLRAPNAQRITLFTRASRGFLTVHGSELVFDATEFAGPYLRAVCYGSGGATAWTQPIRVRGGQWDIIQARLRSLEGAARAVLRATRAPRVPALSGRGDDPAWAAAEPFDAFFRMQDGAPATTRTEARALVADDTLFLAFRCEEPLADELGLAPPDAPWNHDNIEVFLDPAGNGAGSYQILVNAVGGTLVHCRGSGLQSPPSVRAAAAIVRTGAWRGWTAELAVSLRELGGTPAPGTRWGFHLCRNRLLRKHEYLMWSWVGHSNHNRNLYGSLRW